MDEIVNKVQQSGLTEINLEDYYDQTPRVCVDMKDYLTEIPVGESNAFILKEKNFREQLNLLQREQFEGKLVAIFCSVDAIIPTWAYMLICLSISEMAKKVVVGSIETLDNIVFNEAIQKINPSDYSNAKVIIKGCNKYNIPLNAYAAFAAKIKPYAKSIMFGEPCSTVPLYKKPK